MLHVVEHIRYKRRRSRIEFDVGTMMSIVDGIVKQVGKVGAPTLSNGQDVSMYMIRVYKGSNVVIVVVIVFSIDRLDLYFPVAKTVQQWMQFSLSHLYLPQEMRPVADE